MSLVDLKDKHREIPTQQSCVGKEIWTRSGIYNSFSSLPVIDSVHTVVVSLILDRITSYSEQSVLSIGIGTGNMYTALSSEIQSSSLKLVGVDPSEDMIDRCIGSFLVTVCLVFPEDLEVPSDAEVVLCNWNIMSGIPLEDNSVDVIEASFVLHHIFYRYDLILIFREIFRVLKDDGVFILGDIDLDLGGYIESKLEDLLEVYPSVMLGDGIFLCTDINGIWCNFPIFDDNCEADRKQVEYLNEQSLDGLKEEALRYGDSELQTSIEEEIEGHYLGKEFNRTITEWKEIIFTSLGDRRDFFSISVIDSNFIRAEFPDVLDNPFVLAVSNVGEERL
ncbi:MAG: class I SAM-dependent methyltransferase [bacterium]|nr:class I SAM-dependent methyltransferase [bacterium]